MALDAGHYAQHSVLSQGNWATVEVSETGMTLVTDVMLRNLGFSDPSKVRVYGTGGAMVPADRAVLPHIEGNRVFRPRQSFVEHP